MSITIAARFGGVSLAAALLFGPAIAWADSPHFITVGTPNVTSSGDLTISWKEAGLGSTAVTYDLTAKTLTFTYQCFTKSNNKPQGSPNSGGSNNASASVSITPRNGQITEPDGALLLGPQLPPPNVACQGGGLKLCLSSVEYDGVLFEDQTNEVIGFGSENEGPPETSTGTFNIGASATPFLFCFSSQ